ncbi:MAG: MFS transporter [Rhizomicrobium sp.]
MTRTLEQRTIAKVWWRIMPYLMLLYFVGYLNRVSVGIAALTMNKDLGLTATVFGWGAGIFFVGYFFFEVPSNIILSRVGARRWISRIMLTWGPISAALALSQGPWSFYALRFLLGMAEAGFFPGVMLYLTYWFPAAQRSRISAGILSAVPLSNIFGAPLSSWFLTLEGLWGLKGWQVLFVLEGIPAVVLGVVTYFYLTDKPEDAAWLAPEERDWLSATVRAEDAGRSARHGFSLREALTHPRVLACAFIYFGVLVGAYGVNFWQPQIVRGLGLSLLQTGFVTAIPSVFAVAGMFLWAHVSDRSGAHAFHVAAAATVGCLGLVGAAFFSSPVLVMASLSVAAIGINAAAAIFWSLPTSFLSGVAAAGGLALVNAVGNLSGFLGPYMIGALKDATHGFFWPILALSLFPLLAAIVSLLLVRVPAGTISKPAPVR